MIQNDEISRWANRPEIECFEVTDDHDNKALPVCKVIRIEDAPAIGTAKNI